MSGPTPKQIYKALVERAEHYPDTEGTSGLTPEVVFQQGTTKLSCFPTRACVLAMSEKYRKHRGNFLTKHRETPTALTGFKKI